MSGGIDSTVAAITLKDQGYDVVGVYMRNWDSSDEAGTETCQIEKDREDMLSVCDHIGIKSHIVDFSKDYWNDVFVPFIEAYETGLITPNPDVYCNRHIKYDRFLNYVQDELGIGTMATGHYSQLGVAPSSLSSSSHSSSMLIQGVDYGKDQTYFLSMTPLERLARCIFPIGHLTKPQVRAIAMKDHRLKGLNVLMKKESMGICFVGKRSMQEFLGGYISLTVGRFLCVDTGTVIGTHGGRELLTTGQRARVGGCPEPYYVVDRPPVGYTLPNGDMVENGDVLVGKGHHTPYSSLQQLNYLL